MTHVDKALGLFGLKFNCAQAVLQVFHKIWGLMKSRLSRLEVALEAACVKVKFVEHALEH